MLSALCAIASPSVCQSVLSVTRVEQSKWWNVGLQKFPP